MLGVVVNDKLRLDHANADEAGLEDRAKLAGAPAPDPDRLVVTNDFLGAGYGHPTPESESALQRVDGLSLDPVYTAKAMAAALALDAPGPVLFLHTHGPR